MYDLAGLFGFWAIVHAVTYVASVLTIIPGVAEIPIVGQVIAGVAVVGSAALAFYDIAHKDYGAAAVDALGAFAGIGEIAVGVKAAKAAGAVKTAERSARAAGESKFVARAAKRAAVQSREIAKYVKTITHQVNGLITAGSLMSVGITKPGMAMFY